MGLPASVIVTQCAWCKIIEITGADSLPAPALVHELDLPTAHGTQHYHVSHGICPACSARLREGKMPIQTS